MAIYEPPKLNSGGAVASGIGDTLMAGAGIAATIPGVGWAVGGAMALAGGISKIFGANKQANNERKLEKYNRRYQAIVDGEQNQQVSAFNNLQASKSNYNITGVNSSIKSINNMLEPTAPAVPQGGGTGIINNRLT